MIGGPYASSEPEVLLQQVTMWSWVSRTKSSRRSPQISKTGSARRLYRVTEKPDVSRTPVNRGSWFRSSASSLSVPQRLIPYEPVTWITDAVE